MGGEITAHEIARRAGVGIGTFYRRVGTLEALLKAVLGEVLGEIVAKGEEGLANPDPWAGFTTFALSYIHLRNELCDVNKRLGDVLDHSRAELRDRIQLLVERAQQAGMMRTDVTWEDVAFLMVAASSAGPYTLGLHAGARQWDRNLHVILDGLRSPDPSALPGEPPSLAP
ncbi:DNA-binding transcriptional regulator, AcrR family [Nonomuraea jiangxiensis]|uniref:DNA-binding transcriptional regulator, AcrR family n=1 Tax=Nonomuraea jiangxiensis TaxID=633440 RepID=A0A1G9VG17_9ACTN|nr:DNA-binding transcriptional regulator, AcrR family [Nonomuraea jiangxiensis]